MKPQCSGRRSRNNRDRLSIRWRATQIEPHQLISRQRFRAMALRVKSSWSDGGPLSGVKLHSDAVGRHCQRAGLSRCQSRPYEQSSTCLCQRPTGAEFSLLPAQNATGNWVKVVQRVPVKLRLKRSPDMPVLRAGLTATVEIDTGFERPLGSFIKAGLASIGIHHER